MKSSCKYAVCDYCLDNVSASMKPARLLRQTGMFVAFLLLASPAWAAGDLVAAFSGITDVLKSLVRLLIFEWGYYLGIAALALQGYRWWAGHITMMDFLKWATGIVFVFFAPSIVDSIRSSASGTI